MTFDFVTFHAEPPPSPEPLDVLAATQAVERLTLLGRSARRFHPQAGLVLLTNERSQLKLEGFETHRFRVDPDRLMFERMRAQRGYLKQSGFERPLVLLDSDILITADLSPLIEDDFDVAVTWRRSDAPICGGFVVLNNRHPKRVLNFFDAAMQTFARDHGDQMRWEGDQSTLRTLLWNPEWAEPPPMIEAHGARVRFLRSDDYGFPPANRLDAILRPLEGKKALHFKGARKWMMPLYWEAHLAFEGAPGCKSAGGELSLATQRARLVLAEHAHTLAPTDRGLLESISSLRLTTGDPTGSLMAADALIFAGPTRRGHYLRSRALAALGQPHEALAAARNAARLAPLTARYTDRVDALAADVAAVRRSRAFRALSPFSIPPAQAHKAANLGDAFILHAVRRALPGRIEEPVESPRIAPSAEAFDAMKSAGAVVLAGANQLNDRYTIWPGLTAARIRDSNLVFVPFGIGLHEGEAMSQGMSEQTRDIFEVVHERIEFSSWRCPRTLAYLQANLPHLADRFLLTGCPVIFDRPLLDSAAFQEAEKVIAVTVTERGDFFDRERSLLEAVARWRPAAERLLVIHQDFRPGMAHGLEDAEGDPVLRLRTLAHRLGYQIVIPGDLEAGLAIYDRADLHFGSRLHAHLYMLSQNKRSGVVAVDARARSMADLLGFPLADPAEPEAALTIDFESVRARARDLYPTMQTFLRAL